MDPAELEAAFRETPRDPPLPGLDGAARPGAVCRSSPTNPDGKAERVWTEASDSADLKKRIGALPGFGAITITGLGSVLALRFDVDAAHDLVPEPRPASARSTRPRGSPSTKQQSVRTRPSSAPRQRTRDAHDAGPIEIQTLTDGGQRPPISRVVSPGSSRRLASRSTSRYTTFASRPPPGPSFSPPCSGRCSAVSQYASSTTSPTPVRSRCRLLPRPRPTRSRRFRSRRADRGVPGSDARQVRGS